MALACLSKGSKALKKGDPFWRRPLCGPDLLWGTPPSSGELIWCQGNHDIYACSRGGVAMSGDDGMDTSSQVPIVRRTWVIVVASCIIWR
jgi:hypothetical protein